MPVLSVPQLRALAASRPAPVSLYENWFEKQTACILGDNPDRNSEKAIDVALSVARSGRRVLFVDFRHGLDRFLDRTAATNPPNLFYHEIDLSGIDPERDGALYQSIADALKESGARICVIDSLSLLCSLRGKTAPERYFLKIFRNMSVQRDTTFLLTATPRKRIGKSGIVTPDHLPRFTEAYFRAIIPAAQSAELPNPHPAENPTPHPAENPNPHPVENPTPQPAEFLNSQIVENEVGTRHGASAPPVSAKVSELSEKSEPSAPPARPSKVRRKRHRR